MTFLRDPETGHLIGIEQAPTAASPTEREFPKWVEPHASHIHTDDNGHRSVAGFEFHTDRAGTITVLVKDAAEEADALAEKSDKTRLRLVPDAPEDVSDGKPLSPLWPEGAEPAIDPIQANHAASLVAADEIGQERAAERAEERAAADEKPEVRPEPPDDIYG